MSIAQLTLPMFIGTVLNWALFGTLLVQIYIYFLAFPKDPRLSKLVVVSIFILELAETVTNSRDAIRIFGAGWGSMDALNDVGWAFITVPCLGALIASIGQLFYARRLYLLSHNARMSQVSVSQLGAGIWSGIQIYTARELSLLQRETLDPTAMWLAATSLCDLIIVLSTAFYLLKERSPEFQGNTNTLASRMVKLTAETGLLCAAFALVDLYLFATFKGTNYHLAVCMELSKLYSNSTLLILNWRAHIGHRHAPITDISHQPRLTDIEVTRTDSSSSVRVELSHGNESFVSQESDTDEDKRGRLDV
ncbi:hypothetical protein DFH07DRAFT_950773 [Mycena maculata]|uniref:DUF6534 domain-containing protein n=1 Tax=Mycena maculata TaxID=230809 RepID=A0AAD7NX29_9AGAR|nr:hypothetical protein DFH07DRAFT_950773 [Mycena maculata]